VAVLWPAAGQGFWGVEPRSLVPCSSSYCSTPRTAASDKRKPQRTPALWLTSGTWAFLAQDMMR
jgi:hypothetical protein